MKTAYFTRVFDLECREDMLSRIQSKILKNGLERKSRLDGVRHKFFVQKIAGC